MKTVDLERFLYCNNIQKVNKMINGQLLFSILLNKGDLLETLKILHFKPKYKDF